MNVEKKFKNGDWLLVRAGVMRKERMLVEVFSWSEPDQAYIVNDVEHIYNHGCRFGLTEMVTDFGYAVKVPKSSNIEMLELLYLPEKGLLDEEAQN